MELVAMKLVAMELVALELGDRARAYEAGGYLT